jgi:DNA-directed RNA polymerase sigma subunit (sigma70/sigma32)
MTNESDLARERLQDDILSLFFDGVFSFEELAILALRFGLIGGREVSHQEIADTVRFGGDAEQVKQAEAVILRKLRLPELS